MATGTRAVKIAAELERRFTEHGRYVRIKMKYTGQVFYLLKHKYGIEMFCDTGNIWEFPKPEKYFPNKGRNNAIMAIAKYIESIA